MEKKRETPILLEQDCFSVQDNICGLVLKRDRNSLLDKKIME